MNKALLLVASLSAWSLSVSAYAKSPAARSTKPSIDVVPIYLSGRRSLAVVRIGNHPPAPILFDTGGDGNVLDTEYASELKLKYNPSVEVRVEDGTGNFFMAKEAKLPTATLGGVPIIEKRATVQPFKERDVVGIFSPNSFSGKYVLLDLANGRVIVRDKATASAVASQATPYMGTIPAIGIELPGLTVSAFLDSGNDSDLLLPESLAQKLPLRGPLRVIG